MKVRSSIFTLCAVAVTACTDQAPLGSAESGNSDTPAPIEIAQEKVIVNPFFEESPLYLHYPQFDLVENSHYLPAFERGMAEHMAEINAIIEQPAPASFDNTILALETSGQLLNRVSTVFFSMAGANTNDDIRALQQRLAPELAAHNDNIMLNEALFAKVNELYEARQTLALDAQAQRLLERYYLDFVRAGAALDQESKQELKAINAQIAQLGTQFSQNVLSEVNDLAVVVDSREELSGMSDSMIDAAGLEAEERGESGKYVLPLLNYSAQPALSSLQNRELRERLYRTSISRGSRGGDFDNREVMSDVLRLRAERAQMLGYTNHADYILENQTAQTIEAVNRRLSELAPPAAANARREAEALQAVITAAGEDFELQAWDWNFYSEKLKAERFNFDASQLQPYLELNNVLTKGVFYAAEKLFGITFVERFDLPVYQEDVRVFEVFDADNTTLGIFIADFYARPSKRGGAWMNSYVSQNDLFATQPIVANHLNITKPLEGEPTLLTFGEANTMFHEFGHALHGLFSAVEYPYFSGTRVPRDFVEYPSQVNEMWGTWPEVLENYALHYQTGEPMPIELLNKVLAAQSFNQGFGTTEYLAASVIDQAYHQLSPDEVPTADEILSFEAQALADAGLAMEEIAPRYRSTYFSHIMGGYSAGYYSYIWSEVLDADTVEWFKGNGGLTRANGDHFRQSLLSKGGSENAMTLFRNFRGRDADTEPLLIRRGLK
jgi:peptidyl-dipeptidase Dcp